ncbi:MAG: DUF2723 domain-containing protein [Anaerolineales bacterium]|nr:DUF2723 domain-containing protein [Anaerolineales bacterium]
MTARQQPDSITVPPLVHLIWKATALFVGLLALTRIGYEGLFPRFLWLGQPLMAVPLLAIALTLGWLWQRQSTSGRWSAVPLWPLLLNIVPLFTADVDLVRGRFLFLASLWLVGVLYWRTRPRWLGAWLAIGLAPVYLFTMSHTVGAADTFEFQVTAPIMGVVHPTGYPLYLLLGKLWTLLPLGSVAWRLNLGTAVYGLGAAVGLYTLLVLLLSHAKQSSPTANVVAVLTAALYALRPTFWSQSIAAEVYTLHNLIIAGGVLLVLYPLRGVRTEAQRHREKGWEKYHYVYLAALLGLGLTNHLTTLILLPAAGLSFIITLTQSKIQNVARRDASPSKSKILLIPAFLLPLTLYAYLPLRWQAVNDEPMGWSRFIGWVTGDQFQDALQLMAWWRDPTRYEVVGRLFVAEWGWWGLAIAAVGLVYLLWRDWRSGLLLLLTWGGFTFYCLNYYVPDLNVFLLPAHLITAVWVGFGIYGLLETTRLKLWMPHMAVVLFIPVLLTAVTTWHRVDQSQNDGLTRWGRAVLNQPLAENGVILADSEKIAPLLYLQRAEGLRPDLEIKVLPDEAAYRAELTAQLDAGRTVYLGRFVPGLEGIYHLRSAGPLTEVSTEPLTNAPKVDLTPDITFGEITLLGATIEILAAVDPRQTAVTFYWQADQPVTELLYVYTRWAGEKPIIPTGQHPANNYYPTVAWEAGEVVADYHLFPHLYPKPDKAELQVALAPPFTPASELPWQTVTSIYNISNNLWDTAPIVNQAVRIAGDDVHLNGVNVPAQARPQSEHVQVTAVGEGLRQLEFGLLELEQWGDFTLATDVPNGRYTVAARPEQGVLSCGWWQTKRPYCPIGEIEISGVPIPAGATNYGDKIALLDVTVPDTQLQPGGLFNLTLQWQALAQIEEDYTVFVQVLNEQDKIVGQLDSWPLQGTYPTSAWEVGEVINDPYAVQLDPELPAGNYRLIVGFYRLADAQRLPVLGADGSPIDDKYVLSGLRP